MVWSTRIAVVSMFPGFEYPAANVPNPFSPGPVITLPACGRGNALSMGKKAAGAGAKRSDGAGVVEFRLVHSAADIPRKHKPGTDVVVKAGSKRRNPS